MSDYQDIYINNEHRRAESLPINSWFENEPNHNNMIWICEPIINGPSQYLKPYLCFISTVIFYKGTQKVFEFEAQISQGGFTPKLIWHKGFWWEIGCGGVIYDDKLEEWVYKHRLHKNNRVAVQWSGDMWIDDLISDHPKYWNFYGKLRNICGKLREWRILPNKPKKGQEIQWKVIT